MPVKSLEIIQCVIKCDLDLYYNDYVSNLITSHSRLAVSFSKLVTRWERQRQDQGPRPGRDHTPLAITTSPGPWDTKPAQEC